VERNEFVQWKLVNPQYVKRRTYMRHARRRPTVTCGTASWVPVIISAMLLRSASTSLYLLTIYYLMYGQRITIALIIIQPIWN